MENKTRRSFFGKMAAMAAVVTLTGKLAGGTGMAKPAVA